MGNHGCSKCGNPWVACHCPPLADAQATVEALQQQLSQLQALVRALPVVNGKLEVDSGVCYYVRALDGKRNPVVCGLMTEQATAHAIMELFRYRATLPATPTEEAT